MVWEGWAGNRSPYPDLTYPSGRVMTYQIGGAELPLSVTDGATTYAASATYAPQGALTGLAFGGGNVVLSQAYNSRLQPARIQAASAGGTDLLDLDYDFGLGTADNGNVMAILNGRDSTRSQFFAYDALNRITLARTQATTGQTAWGQAFGYDPWGNLLNTNLTQGAAPSFSLTANAQNRIVGYCYDAAGNLLDPGTCNNPHSYVYNAEGQIVSALAGAYTYTYDGDGKRVQKSNGKLYWYGANGDVLAESDASGNITDEYVFFGGKRVARRDAAGNVDYYLADQLGSSRVVTNSAGNVLDDCDYYPFGWDNCVASGSGNNYKFTGKERDAETSLGYFGARYNASSIGRFMTPDPDNAGADPSDPRAWNGYAYVRNNPTTNVDPDGLACVQGSKGDWFDDNSGGQTCEEAFSPEQNNTPSITVTASVPNTQVGFWDFAGQWFVGFSNFMVNGNLSGAGQMGAAYFKNAAFGLVFGAALNVGRNLIGPGSSALENASATAFEAADNASNFVVSAKHFPGAAGGYAKFASGVDIQQAIRQALTSPDAAFLPNNKPNSFVVVTDLGKQIGTAGETAVKVVVGNNGQIWTAYPVK